MRKSEMHAWAKLRPEDEDLPIHEQTWGSFPSAESAEMCEHRHRSASAAFACSRNRQKGRREPR